MDAAIISLEKYLIFKQEKFQEFKILWLDVELWEINYEIPTPEQHTYEITLAYPFDNS